MRSVPPCAYCGGRLVHNVEGGQRLWVLFWPCEGTTASTTLWSASKPPAPPLGWVEADGFICASGRCPTGR